MNFFLFANMCITIILIILAITNSKRIETLENKVKNNQNTFDAIIDSLGSDYTISRKEFDIDIRGLLKNVLSEDQKK